LKQAWESYWSRIDATRLRRQSHSKRRMMAVLHDFLRPGMRVLDAGCGSGWFTATFSDLGLVATALDYSPEALLRAMELAGERAEYVTGNLLDPELVRRLGRRFELVFTDGLLEHFPVQEQVLLVSHLRALLVPGGVLATFVPNLLSPWQLIRPLMMPGIREKPFLPDGLRRLHAGMRILRFGGLNVLPTRLSPERLLGARFGMILYALATEPDGRTGGEPEGDGPPS